MTKDYKARVRPLVIIESPYKGDPENIAYAKRAMRDSIARGERPFASHLLYTQVLDDSDHDDRELGMELGWDFLHHADLVAVYTDRGISEGMYRGMERAKLVGVPIAQRWVESPDAIK